MMSIYTIYDEYIYAIYDEYIYTINSTKPGLILTLKMPTVKF